MDKTRRDFISGMALTGAAAVVAGCMVPRSGSGSGGSMAGFSVPPMKRVRVAMVGLGSRGFAALRRLVLIPGIEIAALCETDVDKIARSQQLLAEKGFERAKEYLGPESYKRLADDGIADVFYNSTPRDLHTELNVGAMKRGMHVLTEVPSGRTVEECWETVETCEKQRVHCMMLENSRDSHIYLDGVTVPMGGYFYSYKGGRTQYPGQWGIAEEDCNCLCWLTFEW